MEEMVSKLFNAVLSEYGAIVLLLIMAIVKLWMSKEQAETRNNELTDKLLDVVSGNTEAITNLANKIDHQKDMANARQG